MCGVRNYFPGQYFTYNGFLFRVNEVYVDDDNVIYYQCDRSYYDRDQDNYVVESQIVKHDDIISNYDLVFRKEKQLND